MNTVFNKQDVWVVLWAARFCKGEHVYGVSNASQSSLFVQTQSASTEAFQGSRKLIYCRERHDPTIIFL